MKISESLIREYVQKSFDDGYIQITDHRRNVLVLENGVFTFNGNAQPKSKSGIEAVFVEAFRLTRFVKLGEDEFIRERNQWFKKR